MNRIVDDNVLLSYHAYTDNYHQLDFTIKDGNGNVAYFSVVFDEYIQKVDKPVIRAEAGPYTKVLRREEPTNMVRYLYPGDEVKSLLIFNEPVENT